MYMYMRDIQPYGIINQKAVIFMVEVKEIQGQNTFFCTA
jgi:hypothetical protein